MFNLAKPTTPIGSGYIEHNKGRLHQKGYTKLLSKDTFKTSQLSGTRLIKQNSSPNPHKLLTLGHMVHDVAWRVNLTTYIECKRVNQLATSARRIKISTLGTGLLATIRRLV